MSPSAQTRYHYCVATVVGICFGLLVGGAVAFVMYVEQPAPTVHGSPAPAPATGR